jgi:hypothetical protein
MKVSIVPPAFALRLTLAPIALPILLFASPLATTAQSAKPLIDSQNYVFLAQIAQPLHGPIRHMTTDNYTLQITKDKIVSDLPYFGRAYTAPMDPDQNGLRFTSEKFSYTLTPGKKDGWIVVIKPKDNRDIQQLQLTISSDGYSSLQVLSSSRDPISFNGVITAPDNP